MNQKDICRSCGHCKIKAAGNKFALFPEDYTCSNPDHGYRGNYPNDGANCPGRPKK